MNSHPALFQIAEGSLCAGDGVWTAIAAAGVALTAVRFVASVSRDGFLGRRR